MVVPEVLFLCRQQFDIVGEMVDIFEFPESESDAYGLFLRWQNEKQE